MPIPLSVTNPKGVGLVAANPSELPTQGPFSRLGGDAISCQRSGEGAVQQQAPSSGADQAMPDVAAAPVTEEGAKEEYAVTTEHLSFWYPGIGAWWGVNAHLSSTASAAAAPAVPHSCCCLPVRPMQMEGPSPTRRQWYRT